MAMMPIEALVTSNGEPSVAARERLLRLDWFGLVVSRFQVDGYTPEEEIREHRCGEPS
jgi:hypothetical protein